MIKNNFYSTDSTLYDGIELTNHLLEITGFTETMADAYLMGYIPADKMPAAFMPVYLSGGVGEMSAIYHPKNTGWGYGWLDLNAEYRYATSFTRVNGSIIARPDTRTQYRLFNSIKMARANTGMQISILFTFAFIDDAVYDGDGGTVDFVQGGLQAGGWGQATQTISYTFDQFADIIKNDLPLFSITKTGNTGVINGKSFTFSPRPSEFGDSNDTNTDHKWLVDSGQGARAIVFIDGYSINTSMSYANGNGGGNTYYLRPFTYPDIDAVGNFPATKSMLFPAELSNMSQRLNWAYNTDTGIFELTPGNTQTYTIADYNVNPGGFNFGTITENDADFTSPTQGSRTLLIKKSLWLNATGYGTRKSGNIQNMYTPMDIYRHALLYHKHTTDGTQISYGDGNTWTTRFNASDAPTGEILTGSFSDIASNLRPWQLPDVDISADNFKPEDIPIPEPEDVDSTGDDIADTNFNNITIGAGNNFVTLYGMTSAGVSDMGEKLWASLSDPAYWQTVGTVFTNDFSINPADMLKYFLSLRYFPFNLGLLPYDPSDGVFIGRATAPLLPSAGIGRPIRLQKSICQLDGGSLTIRRKYNDFRDFEPCTTVQIHVPFCGTVDVPASEVVGKTLSLTYKIDLQTGAMLGVIAVQSNTYYVIATVAGSCGASIPITANNNIEFLQRIATVAGSGISGGISGGIKGASVGGEVGAVAGAIAGSVGGGVGALAGLPPVTVHKQGNASGFANLGGVPCAYATIQRQRYSVPDNYGHTSGYACDVSETVGNLSGFAVCENVDTSGLSCNATERAEIKRLLESGVYI